MVFNIEKFFCFKLEATAIFIAWIGILSQSFSLFIQLPNLIYMMFFATFHDDNDIGRFLTVVLFLSMIAISCFLLWLCKTLLDGVQTRNYRLMKPYLIINGAGVISGVIILICFNLYFILIVYGSLGTYLHLCLYTLYKNIQSEQLGQGQGLPYYRATVPTAPPLDDVKTFNDN